MEENKSIVEEKLMQGIHGVPDLNREERSYYLGELRERILVALTAAQVEERGIYAEVVQALKDPRASLLILRRDVSLEHAAEYIALAQKQKVAFKRVDAPEFRGEIGLVVVAADAVEVPEVLVMDRKTRLLELGFSAEMIDAVGKPLCHDCWHKLAEKAPEELANYRRITWVDVLMGTRCQVCSEKKKIM